MLPLSSCDRITLFPQIYPRNSQTQRRPGKIQLNDGPEPQDAQGRGLLHDVQVAELVADVDEIRAAHAAHDEEDGLAERMLVFEREEAGEEHGV
jgi:hypothetical protein